MNTLHFTSDYAAQEIPLRISGQKVWRLLSDAPVGQVAEAFMLDWFQRPIATLILVPEQRQAAFLAAIRTRVSKWSPADEGAVQELSSAVRRLTDTGGCLVSGGQPGQASLVTNLKLHCRLLESLGEPIPLLMIGTLEENAADLDSLRDFLRDLPAPRATR